MTIPALFTATRYGGRQTYYVSAADRLRAVAECTDAAMLRDTLAYPELQATVRAAVERRLRRLDRETCSHE